MVERLPKPAVDPEIAARKSALRSRIREALGTVDAVMRHTGSVETCARVMRLEQFVEAQSVMLYMPMASEIDVTPIALRCFQTGRTVGVPRIDAARHDMMPVEVESLDDGAMEVDALGVRTPRGGAPIPLDLLDVVVVPGLAFDTSGHRLGRGGGYYDRFLSKLPSRVLAIGVALDLQIVDVVPAARHDLRVDVIVTERRITYTGAVRSTT